MRKWILHKQISYYTYLGKEIHERNSPAYGPPATEDSYGPALGQPIGTPGGFVDQPGIEVDSYGVTASPPLGFDDFQVINKIKNVSENNNFETVYPKYIKLGVKLII